VKQESKISEVIVPVKKANALSFLVFFILLATFGLSFATIWGAGKFFAAWRLFFSDYVTLAFSIIGGMVAHEACPALIWGLFAQKRLSSIHFGFAWRQLAPFVHCSEYLPLQAYRWGVLAPGILLGVVPALLSLFTGGAWLHVISMFMTAGAAGDFYCAHKLTGTPKNAMILDHPEHLGFFIRTS
jgi:hypothetical protein